MKLCRYKSMLLGELTLARSVHAVQHAYCQKEQNFSCKHCVMKERSCFSWIQHIGASFKLSVPGCLHLVDSIMLIIPVITKALPGYILYIEFR